MISATKKQKEVRRAAKISMSVGVRAINAVFFEGKKKRAAKRF